MKQWVTEYLVNGCRFGGDVYGASWEEAQVNADVLGLGIVQGELVAKFDNKESAQSFWEAVGGIGLGPAHE